MAAPIYYRWDDAYAPVARGERTSLIEILTACLVTGYGDKPGAGWERLTVNAEGTKAWFRNNTTTGLGFPIMFDAARPGLANHINVMAYEAMSDIDTGLLPFRATPTTISVSGTANTTARPWVVVADDRGFYFVCWISNTASPGTLYNVQKSEFFYGDLIKIYPSDQFAAAMFTGNYDNVGNQHGYSFNMASPNTGGGGFVLMPRKRSGTPGAVSAHLIHNGGPSGAYPGTEGIAKQPDDPLIISRPYINNAEAYTMRAFFPGLYAPCHKLSFRQLEIVQWGGKELLSIVGSVGGGSHGNYFISLSDWWI